MTLHFRILSMTLLIAISNCNGKEPRLGSVTSPLTYLKTRTIKEQKHIKVTNSDSIKVIVEMAKKNASAEKYSRIAGVSWPRVELSTAKEIVLEKGDSYYHALEKLSDALKCNLHPFDWGVVVIPKDQQKLEKDLTGRDR